MVNRGNFEIPTRRLKASCSASELPVHVCVWWEWSDLNQLTLRTDLQSATPLQLRRTPLFGALGRTRTYNQRIRNLVLYPVELPKLIRVMIVVSSHLRRLT